MCGSIAWFGSGNGIPLSGDTRISGGPFPYFRVPIPIAMDRYITLFPFFCCSFQAVVAKQRMIGSATNKSGYEDQMGDPNMQGQTDFNSITNGNAASPQGDGDQVTMHRSRTQDRHGKSTDPSPLFMEKI